MSDSGREWGQNTDDQIRRRNRERSHEANRVIDLSRTLETLIDAVEEVQDWDIDTRVGAALHHANRVLTGAE